MLDILISILVVLAWLAVIVIIIYYGRWFYSTLQEKDDNGWDMFCEEHYKEAMEHIQSKHPKHQVGYAETIRDKEFDTDGTMECGYPGCTKEAKYEVDWIKF